MSADIPPEDPDADDGADDVESVEGEIAVPTHEAAVSGTTEAQIITSISSHEGPLPSKDWFEGVEALAPGATDLILRDYEKERAHQREIQKEAIQVDKQALSDFSRYQTLRLAVVGVIAIIFAAGGVACVLAGKSIAGLAILATELAGLVYAFFERRRRRNGG